MDAGKKRRARCRCSGPRTKGMALGRESDLSEKNILGRGAVRDTCNLLADGIVKLLRALAAVEKSSVKVGQARGEGSGSSVVDWTRARQALAEIEDAATQGELGEDVVLRKRPMSTPRHPGDGWPQDPAAVLVVDTDSQARRGTGPAAPDNLRWNGGARNTGVPVEEAIDAAYGDGDTRQAFADARRLVARVPGLCHRLGRRQLHLSGGTGYPHHRAGGKARGLQAFQFLNVGHGLRSQCIAAKGSRGRRVLIHPQEALLHRALTMEIERAGWW